ncbi:MAG: glycosyltransferase family 39 protein [Acidobacteriota bacterium]
MGKLRIAAAVVAVAAAAAFHVWAATRFVSEQPPDSTMYVQLAKNLIEHGSFSIDTAEPYAPTLIRLPGYPLFLAAVYSTFGIDNESAVRVSQGLIYTLTCLLAGILAAAWTNGQRRRRRAAMFTFLLAAVCPFTLVYTAALLTETLTTTFLIGTLLAATFALRSRKSTRSLWWWATAGLLAGLNVMLRPDAGLFAFGIGLTIVVSTLFGPGRLKIRLGDRIVKGLVFSIAFLMPLVPWTIRNEQVFGVFQPLAPAHAEMPGEFVSHGYFLWLRTWIDDPKYISPMLWDLELKPIDIKSVPPYAFASDDERARVQQLLDSYNNSDPDHPAAKPTPQAEPDDSADDDSESQDDQAANNQDAGDDDHSTDEEWDLKISPEVDAGFQQLASERIEREPFRFYVWLPAKRAYAMWFDTHSDFYPFAGELFPLKDLDENTGQEIWLPLFAALNVIFSVLAFGGIITLCFSAAYRSRMWLLLVLLTCIPRIAFFGTLENPEPRYLVELFILAAILAGIFIAHLRFIRESRGIGLAISFGEEKAEIETQDR